MGKKSSLTHDSLFKTTPVNHFLLVELQRPNSNDDEKQKHLRNVECPFLIKKLISENKENEKQKLDKQLS